MISDSIYNIFIAPGNEVIKRFLTISLIGDIPFNFISDDSLINNYYNHYYYDYSYLTVSNNPEKRVTLKIQPLYLTDIREADIKNYDSGFLTIEYDESVKGTDVTLMLPELSKLTLKNYKNHEWFRILKQMLERNKAKLIFNFNMLSGYQRLKIRQVKDSIKELKNKYQFQDFTGRLKDKHGSFIVHRFCETSQGLLKSALTKNVITEGDMELVLKISLIIAYLDNKKITQLKELKSHYIAEAIQYLSK